MPATDWESGSVSPAEVMLQETLGGLQESAAYCLSESCPLVLPGLHVEEFGEVSLPISKRDARRLIKLAVQAPYGRGEDTIVDTDVRRVWQFEPAQFRLENPQWDTLLKKIVKSVKAGFGIRRKVSASLYKLLVYEKGGFFLPHRDTEKSHQMFATLTICLPSKHTGGELIVSHGGKSQTVDFGQSNSKYDLQWAAFYADCQHEVRPVTDGYRICLVYNLATIGRQEQPVAPEFGEAIDLATEAVELILDEQPDRDLIIVPLLHQYSEAGMTSEESEYEALEEDLNDDWDEWGEDRTDPDGTEGAAEFEPLPLDGIGELDAEDATAPGTHLLELKGGDRARVEVLKQAADRVDCSLHIAFLTRHQRGYPNYDSMGYDGREPIGNAEFEEVFDDSTTLTHWYGLDGLRQPLSRVSVDGAHVLGGDDLSYEQSVQEATGNEGMSMDRWYHHAVCVLWPTKSRFSVLVSQGPRNSVPMLKQSVASAKGPGSWDECRVFADAIIGQWPNRSDYGDQKSQAADLAQSLVAIGDPRLAAAFLKDVLPQAYPLQEEDLIALAEMTAWKSIQAPLRSLFRDSNPAESRADLAGLMATFATLAGDGDRTAATRIRVGKALLKEVIELLTRWTKRGPRKRHTWDGEPLSDFDGAVEPLVRGLAAVGTSKDLKWLLSEIAAKGKHYQLYKAVIPATLALVRDAEFAESSKLAASAVEQLREFCVVQLKALTQKAPKPPANWRRRAKLSCPCEDCRELEAFMRDKEAEEHRFARRKELRRHLHGQIETHRLDCTHETERRGSPHTLVCKKTLASFERDHHQYLANLELLAELKGGG